MKLVAMHEAKAKLGELLLQPRLRRGELGGALGDGRLERVLVAADDVARRLDTPVEQRVLERDGRLRGDELEQIEARGGEDVRRGVVLEIEDPRQAPWLTIGRPSTDRGLRDAT
ncbi:hypothetical protein [Sorangium sp. So ce233]|uniref:hypothetical protein n=1 Tax=Sorangium sp. So ce233 TaxID=3133290 RepID=UPI003F614E3A